MRIAKSALIEPTYNHLYGTVAIALSLFVFAYSSRFGPVSILAYYALWFPLVLVDYRRVIGNSFRYLWIFGFALVCFLSVFWSQAPSVSIRAAVQYLSHVICALIIMRTMSVETLSRGAVAGCGIVLVYSLLFGSYLYDALDGTYSFVGAFSSKNQLGFYASLGVFFCFATAMVFRARGLWLAGCGVVGLTSAYSLLASQSATSVITTFAVVALCIGLQMLTLLAPKSRRMIFAAALVIAAGGGVAALQFGAMDAILAIFGKDSTLTGRTYLWQQGIAAAGETPFFGVGYQGYWVPGFAEAERLWQDFFITSRSGFHFHNTYIEAMVETGLLGTILLVFNLFAALTGHLKRFLTARRNPESLVLLGIASLLLVRSFVEVDIMHPYHVGSFLFYFAVGKLTLAEPRLIRPYRDALVPGRYSTLPG